MSDKSKKIVWIAIAVCSFAFIVLLSAFFIFKPASETELRPFDLTRSAPAKPAFPNDFSVFPSIVVQTAPDNSSNSSSLSSSTNTSQSQTQSDSPKAANETKTSNVVVIPAPSTPPAPSNQLSKESPSTTGSTTNTTQSSVPKAPSATPEPAKPLAAPSKPTTISTPQPAQSSSEAWIQVGSFSAKSTAQKLYDECLARGMTAIISEKIINGKTYYQVKIGPYSSTEEAKKWLATAKAIPGASSDAFVTSR